MTGIAAAAGGVHAHAGRIDRVPVPDQCCLWAEEPATPMIIALVGTVEGGPLTDASGRLRLDWVRRHVAARLHRAPMLRRLLLPTRLGQGPQAASPLAFRWLDRRRTLPVASPPVAATSPPGR